jgi:predicted ATPase/DNA-binding XRE family transcriptional regulator
MATTQGPESFGALLQRHRRATGLSQEELAERAGLSRRGISDLERGARRLPYLATLRRLAQALELNATDQTALLAAAHPPWGVGSGAPTGRLPTPLTSFVGRQRDLAEVRRVLGTTRLLTLTGAGGIGKTRLAIEAARGHPEAVFVDLAPLTDGRLVAAAVAAMLGLNERPGVAWLDVLASNLTSRRALLVLDNCEHLADACAELSEGLLRACPDIGILATSRQPLGVAGEQLWPVPPLPTAAPASSGSDAVPAATRLFVDRARLVQPAFALDEQTARLVTDNCRQLDGLPLAIELAAARVPLLGLEGLRERLDQRLPLLKSKTHGAPVRHQTLGAAIAWSYDLLSEAERALFRRVAVFAGGWTYEAAEAIGGDGPVAAHALLDVLDQLADKSLIQTMPEAGGSVRYRMLETVRQFARAAGRRR